MKSTQQAGEVYIIVAQDNLVDRIFFKNTGYTRFLVFYLYVIIIIVG